MKKRKLLLRLGLACLLALYGLMVHGQGTSCGTSNTIGNSTIIHNITTTGTEVWYSFTAADTTAKVILYNPTDTAYGSMSDLYLYGGTCNSITQLEHDSAEAFGDTTIKIIAGGLTINSTYYIKATRTAPNCSCSKDTAKFSLGVISAPADPNCPTSGCLVDNPSFTDTLPGTWIHFADPFTYGDVCHWKPSQGTPSIFNSGANSSPYSVLMWSAGTALCPGGVLGEGVYQDLATPVQASEPYCLIYSLKRSGNVAVPDAYVKLANNIVYNGACMPTASNQIIDHPTNVNNTTWQQRVVCFTPTTAWQQVWVHPSNTQSTACHLAIDDLNLYPIKDAGTSQISCGTAINLGPVCPIPGATYSWTPTAGLSNPNIANPVATPTVTTTYTMSVTTPGNTCTYTDTVTIYAGITSVNASGNQTICVGQNVQLTASGGVSYAWSPATGLSNPNISNPVASPTVTTTYTVTVTDSYGCQASKPITVTLNPLPTCNITGNITSVCSGTGTFSTTSNANYSYNWSVSPSATITSGQGTNAVNVDFSANIAQNYTITVVVTNTVTSCQNTCTYFVGQCCTPVDGVTLYNDTISNYGSTITGQLGINGLLVIDNNCTFRGVDAQMGYNAKILIQPGASLTITDNTGTTSKLYACNYMWDGIYIDGSTASLTVNNGSSIEDAQSAVVSNNGGVYTIGGTPTNGNVKLNKNYKNIVVNTYSSAHTGTVTGTTISCKDNATTVTYNSTPDGLLRPPHNTRRTYAGIEVNNVTNSTALAVGSASNANLNNDFDNMDYGIIATNSNVTVKNNDFINITSPGFSKTNTNCPIGTAICARGNSSLLSNQRTITVGGSGSNELNTIMDGGVGIDAAVNLHLNVTYNTFTNLSLVGIKAVRNYLRTVTFSNNTFRDAPVGISTYDLRGCNITMSLNSMNMKNKTNAQGIVVSETFPTPLTRYTINHNTIDTVRNGIVGSTLVSSRMDNNTIRLKHTANPNAYGRGIYLSGTKQPYVRSNTIYGENRNDWWAEGVRLDLCNTDTVACNSTDDLGAGQFFSGDQPFTYFAKNSMTDHLWGLLLNAGRIWDQGVNGNPNDNTWNGTFTLAATHAFHSFGSQSAFYVQSSSAYNPTLNTYNPLNPVLANPFVFNTVTSTSSLLCSSPTAGGDLNRAMEIGAEIVADTIVYPAYSDENVWLSKWALFNYIKGDSGMLEEQAIADFYETANGDNFGKLYDVLEIMGNMDNLTSSTLQDALEINNTIDPQNDIETNWKAVNEILITNAINDSIVPTETQLGDLRLIAQQCPLSDGPAVYIARAILATYDTSYVEYEDVCEQPDTSTGSGSRLMGQQSLQQNEIKLYPNPNSGDMLLAYELAEGESGELVIFDLAGKQVAQVALAQGQKVMPFKAELPNGIYLYRVTVNGEVRKADKLVIVR